MATAQKSDAKWRKILVINPNSSKVMTGGLDNMITDLGYHESTQVETYTAPSGPSSINNEDDAAESAKVLIPALQNDPNTSTYSGFLVACYSMHPLTTALPSILPPNTPVIGIFEASISSAISLLPPPTTDTNGMESFQKFGIVTTGTYWESVLKEGALKYVIPDRFKGVFSTGLSAGELHTTPAAGVRKRMIAATRKLVGDGDVKVVCLGCAGMAGMDEIVREACVEELGAEKGAEVRIVDGVKAGIGLLDSLIRSTGS